MLQGQHAHPKVDDPRKEDPPWLALIQQLVDGYTYCPLPTTAHHCPLLPTTAHCPLPTAHYSTWCVDGWFSPPSQRGDQRGIAWVLPFALHHLLRHRFRKHYVRLLDLYLWAVASGRPPMAAALWRRCKHPLRAALIGQEMCGRIRTPRPHSLATYSPSSTDSTDSTDRLN